ALAVLLAAILSLAEIRRTLGPLGKLLEATRRVGERDFSTAVDVHSHDELGALATMFNATTARLGGQFTALLTLSEIDQAILSRLDLERIIETVVVRMRDIVPADFVSIAIVDRNAADVVRIYTCDPRRDGRLEIDRAACSAADTRVLLSHPEGLWIDRAQAV